MPDVLSSEVRGNYTARTSCLGDFSNSSSNWLACRVGSVVLCRVLAVAEAVASEDQNSEVIQSPNRSGRHDRAVFIVNAKC